MPQVSPFVKLFLAILAALVVLFGWQRADMAALETRFDERFIALEARFDERFTRLEAGQIELRERMVRMDERLDRLEAGQTELRERTARIEAGQTELRERMARIEGTVAGALARPGSLAQAGEEGEAGAN